jgi:hypothetical protein
MTKWAERGYCWLILFTVETVAAFSANFPEASCASNADTKFPSLVGYETKKKKERRRRKLVVTPGT